LPWPGRGSHHTPPGSQAGPIPSALHLHCLTFAIPARCWQPPHSCPAPVALPLPTIPDTGWTGWRLGGGRRPHCFLTLPRAAPHPPLAAAARSTPAAGRLFHTATRISAGLLAVQGSRLHGSAVTVDQFLPLKLAGRLFDHPHAHFLHGHEQAGRPMLAARPFCHRPIHSTSHTKRRPGWEGTGSATCAPQRPQNARHASPTRVSFPQ